MKGGHIQLAFKGKWPHAKNSSQTKHATKETRNKYGKVEEIRGKWWVYQTISLDTIHHINSCMSCHNLD